VNWPQSMLGAAGPHAAGVESLWWLFFWITAGVYVLVMIALLVAVLRRRRPVDPRDPAASRRAGVVITGATGVTLVLLFVLLISSVRTGRYSIQGLADPSHLNIKLTGNQWWWNVEYESTIASQRVRTANEIHIPTGRPVLLKLRSSDVIHSFWVPNLAGKKDLIPGHETELWIQADRPGVYRGQCAEFCGPQHAHMALAVVAEPADKYAAWLDAQRRPAAEPQDQIAKRGRDVFLSGPCVMCHSIRGTGAGGRTAPDLTHLGSRLTLAAGTVPNTPGHLAGWITDAQGIKPGNRMPTIGIGGEDLQALLKYLQTLE
jgi:cytochrome c oxidase subunit II